MLAGLLAPLQALDFPRPETITKFVYDVLFLPFVFGLLGIVLLRLLTLVSVSQQAAAITVAALLLATPLLAYARIGQEENLLALAYSLLLVGFVTILGEARWSWLLVGGSAAFALATRLASVPSIAVMLVAAVPCFIRDVRNRSSWLWMVAGAALMLSAVAAYGYWNWVRFGSILESGYRFGFARLGVPDV